MAKYKKTCKICGKEFVVELFGNHKKREYDLSFLDTCPNGCNLEIVPDKDWAK